MRVLFVVPYVPSRIRVRSFGFIGALARDHQVTVLALARGADEAAGHDLDELRRRDVVVRLVYEPPYAAPLRMARCAVSLTATREPLQVAFAAAPRLRAAITREVGRGEYDVLHVEHVRGLGALPAALPLPVVWDAVDCVSLLFEESARGAASRLLRLASPLEARRLRMFEGEQVRRFAQVLVTSERDKQALLALARGQRQQTPDGNDAASASAECADGHIRVLPHGLDHAYFAPDWGPRQPEEIVFSGKMNYHANVAGVKLLVDHIMPLVWRSHPEAHLTIAGAHPPADVRLLGADPRVTVTGYVPDLRPLIRAARVAVSPLPYAVGIQNKVLEAMALATPVVASTSAAQGLRAITGRDLLVGETPEMLAAAICRVLDEPTLARSLAEHGVQYVARHHDWDVALDGLVSAYDHARTSAAPVTVGSARESARESVGAGQPPTALPVPRARPRPRLPRTRQATV